MGIFECVLQRADTVGEHCDFVMEYFGVGEYKPNKNWRQGAPVTAELTICLGQRYLLPLPVVREPVGYRIVGGIARGRVRYDERTIRTYGSTAFLHAARAGEDARTSLCWAT